MNRIAHRGCADQYPENTVLAARRVADDVDAIEIDVRRCGSGELVVVHDDTIDRVTDGTGRVADLSLAALQAHEVLDAGEPIPTLASFLDAVPDAVGVNVELKERGLAAAVAAELAARENWFVVSSFDVEALAEMRAVDDSIPLALLFQHDPDENLARAVELDCEYVHPSARLCLTTNVVADAHRRGLDVNAWTATRATIATALVKAGVDGVIADRTDCF